MLKKHIILIVSFFFFSLINHIHAIDYTPELVEEVKIWFDQEKYKKHYPCDENPVENWFSQEKGITEESYGEELIVSMTSHPPRIGTTYLAIESLLRQSVKPNRIILNLALEDFPGGIDDPKIPQSLKILRERGLEIRFSDINYRVATKLIPTYVAFPEATIITADDDRIYHTDLIKSLWEQHQKYPSNIISSSARQYVVEIQDNFIPFNYLPHDLDHTLFLDQEGYGIFEGFAGVLYPVNALHQEIANVRNFKLLTPCADDVWYQIMAMLQGTKVRGLPSALNQQLRNPLEIDGTQASGLFHEHLNANSVMVYNALRFYQLLDQANIPYVEAPICKACRRVITIPMAQEASSSYEVVEIKKTKKCKTCFNDNRKKILCVGAYDYGNIGDKLYKIILKHQFGNEYDVRFALDTVRMNKKGKYININSKEEDFDFDYLIVGGGGILKNLLPNNSLHYYIEQAYKKQKPYFITSVGLQTSIQDPTTEQVRHIIGDTIGLLREASLISVRSLTDYNLLRVVLGEELKYKLSCCPDLGYLIGDVFPPAETDEKKYITLIQTGSANVKSEYVQQLINEELLLYPDAILAVMNWGGIESPSAAIAGKYFFKEQPLFDKKMIKEYFPQAKKVKVYMGGTLSKELKDLRHKECNIKKADLSPKKAARIVRESYKVITGRYHGKIAAVAYGIPCEVPMFTYKLLNEDESNFQNPIEDAKKQIKQIKTFIEYEGELIKPLHLWDGDDRNNVIVKIHARNSRLPVSHIQAMPNKIIYQFLWGYN
ncbi:MAG: polysaccharide pyruvyl transferase family protein [Alphaproteobacteria bacterium]|nr:polysaccharide pyruvyl transferase family protein [Alphaproteobacteria bacterium]